MNGCVATIERLKRRLPGSSAAGRLIRGTFWTLSGTVLARGMSVLASIYVARHLGMEGFGAFGVIQSTVLNIAVFVSYGLGVTATKYLAEFRTRNPFRAGRILALSGAVSLVSAAILAGTLFALAPWLAESTLAAPELGGLLRIGAVALFFATLNGAQSGALAGFEAFRLLAKVNLAGGLVTFVCLAGGAAVASLQGVIWGFAVSSAALWALTHAAVRSEVRRAGLELHLRGMGEELPVLARFSLPAVLASSLFGPVVWVCNVILVNQPGGYGQMGLFNATNQWFALVMFLPQMLGQVVMPMLAEAHGRNDPRATRQIACLAVKVNGLGAGVIVLCGSLASPGLMGLYGEGYSEHWPVLVVALATAGLLAVQTPLWELLSASGRQWLLLALNVVWAAVVLGFTKALVVYGALGLVSARLVAFTAKTVLVVYCARRLLRKQAEEAAP